MAPTFTNLDTLASFQRLAETSRPSLEAELTAEAVRTRECAYDVGSQETLAYNYAAKAVSDEVVDRLAALADEAELLAKYRMILSGEIMKDRKSVV